MGKIYMRRGDTEEIKIGFYKGWVDYKPTDLENGDVFTLTVRDKRTKEVVVSKKITYPNNVFRINHIDTKHLEPKIYEYDVEWRKPNDDPNLLEVKTLIVDDFEIGLDVTYGDS